jgi:SNF2 family DNA or RNA helicase
MEFRGNVDALKKLSNDIFVNRGVRLNRDSIPNFPESQIIAECYEMDKEDQDKINSAYEEMQLELLKIEKLLKKDKKSTELTAILRMRQSIEMVKIPLFIEMIEESLENNMSVAVFLNFTESINALAERLNTKCIVNGIVKDKERQKNIDDFQSDKQRVILINIAAGGAGISLHDITGKHPRISLISPSYSAVNMRQSMGRVWRDGAKSKSIQKIVFVSGTIEERVCNTVNQKLANLDLLNDGDLTRSIINN